MVEWLTGNRIIGTTAERPALGLQSPSVGGWVELARTTLGSAGDAIDVSALADKRYLMVLGDFKASGGIAPDIRLNADTGSNYAYRVSADGGADVTSTSNDFIHSQIGVSTPEFIVGYFANYSTKEKLYTGHLVAQSTAGAGTAPQRVEITGKHAQTSNPISAINYVNRQAGDFNTGSEVVVLGWDPADTHTTNFWEELASAELSSASMRIDSGTFTAKKYLWIQIYNTAKPSGGNSYVYFNNVVTGTTHSGRSNTNGRNPTNQSSQSDYQLTSSNGSIINHDVSSSGTATGMFTNMFVINNASKEKLSIVKSVSGWTNAGSGVAPAMFDCVGKWANTTDAITSVQCGSTSVSTYMGAGSIIKVWGSD